MLMRRIRKKWLSPSHPWQRHRIISERKLIVEYGLKNHREIWRAKWILKRIRDYARSLIAIRETEEGKKLIEKFINRLYKWGLVEKDAQLDDVLDLTVRDILDRRLQTIVYKKGLARTPKQARQLIVHRHILVGERIISAPSYLVKRGEENLIRYRDPSLKEKIWAQEEKVSTQEGGE